MVWLKTVKSLDELKSQILNEKTLENWKVVGWGSLNPLIKDGEGAVVKAGNIAYVGPSPYPYMGHSCHWHYKNKCGRYIVLEHLQMKNNSVYIKNSMPHDTFYLCIGILLVG